MSNYKATRLKDIEVIDDGRQPMRPVRTHLGISAFGVTSWTGAAAGDRIINEHDEDDEWKSEELYFVHAGRASFEIDGERVDAPSGTFVFVRPSATRTAFAEEPGTSILAIGGTVGQAYENLGWETFSPLRGLYESERYDELIERGRALIEKHPDSPLLLYNLACCESLTGDKDAAMTHLRSAVKQSDRLRSYAAADSDLDAIREEPGFEELVGES
jgi:tetratricopeptide (TPR) repeat protein